MHNLSICKSKWVNFIGFCSLVYEELQYRIMNTLSTNYKILLWTWETQEIDVLKKIIAGVQLHVLQKVMGEFCCFLSGGLGQVSGSGKCDHDEDAQRQKVIP